LTIYVGKSAEGCAGWLYRRGFANTAFTPYQEGRAESVIVHGFTGRQYLMESFAEAQEWFPQIQAISTDLIKRAGPELMRSSDRMQDSWTLVGLDFMPDSSDRIWLLEVNSGPVLFLAESPFRPSREADNLTRTMLFDMADLRISTAAGREIDPENGWISLFAH